ncbi:MAG: AsmA-like C-terminal region-containing protein, partial [Parvibaculaceae bacterium]
LFNGIFLPTDAGPQLSGNFSGEAGSLRDFVGWAWPEGKADVERVWSGARGRLKLQAKIDAVSNQLRLQDVAYQLDDSSGTGGLALSFGERPAADIRIDASRIDVDSYLPRGVKGGGWIEVAGLIPQWAKEHDLRLTIQTGEALINGVNARDVAIDVAAEKGSIDLKTVEIGNVGNARLETIGLISPAETGIEGSLSTSVIAEDPRGLLRLFGLIPQDADPLWTRALGKTDLRIAADFASDAGGQTAKYKVAGKSGLLGIDAAFDAAGSLYPPDSELSGGATITSDTGAGLLALGGFVPAVADTQPASLRFTATGSLNAGLVAEAEASVLGMKSQFQGKLSRSEGALSASGRAGFLSEHPGLLLAALGISGVEAANTLSFESDVALTQGGLAFTSLKGFAGASPISGEISIDADRRVKGDLATGPLALDRLLALTFLPWNGRKATMEDSFALTLPGGVTGELWLRPSILTVYDGLSIPESQIGISATTGERRLVALGRAGSNGDVNVEIGGKNTIAGFDMDAHAVLPVDLGKVLRFSAGGRAATGLFKLKLDGKASGRTPAAVMAAFNGTLSYDIANLAVAGIDANSFVNKARDAKTAEDLKAALVSLTAQGEVELGSAKGEATIANGVVALPAFSADDVSARITFTPKIDIGESRLDANAHVEWKGLGNAPASDIAFGGPPTALTRFADTAALESALGFRIFERGLKELERVQAEQKRLAEEEERQRKEDEEKLAAYLAQRRENQLRLREIRVHRVVREQEAAQRKAEIEQAIADGAKQNKAELRLRIRERTVHRAMQRLDRLKAAAEAKAEREQIDRIKADL